MTPEDLAYLHHILDAVLSIGYGETFCRTQLGRQNPDLKCMWATEMRIIANVLAFEPICQRITISSDANILPTYFFDECDRS